MGAVTLGTSRKPVLVPAFCGGAPSIAGALAPGSRMTRGAFSPCSWIPVIGVIAYRAGDNINGPFRKVVNQAGTEIAVTTPQLVGTQASVIVETDRFERMTQLAALNFVQVTLGRYATLFTVAFDVTLQLAMGSVPR